MLCYMCVCFAFSDLCVDSIRTCASRELDRPFFQFTDLGPTSSSHWRGAFPAFRTSDFPSMTASRVGTMLIVSAVRFRPSIRSATFFLPWPLAPGISFPSTPKVEGRGSEAVAMVGVMAVEATEVAMAEADNRASANRRAFPGSGGGRGSECFSAQCFRVPAAVEYIEFHACV